MSDDELLVTISGAAFSLLLYENRRTPDQIGFFLGEILVYDTKKVTDRDREIEHTKYQIDIKSVMAYPTGDPFFDTIGKINSKILEQILGERVKNVVGWYHFREEFPKVSPTMRDNNLHSEITTFFTSKNDLLVEENFLFCNLTSSLSKIGGTHKFKHQLLRKESEVYKPVSLKINNLGADASRADGSDYKPRPTRSSNYDAFNKVYSHIRKDLENVSGVEAVTMIQDAADKLLQQLIPKISESDQLVSELENQVFVLRNEYYRRQYLQKRLLQEKMEQMEVDSKSDSETQSPQSPEMFQLEEMERSPESSRRNIRETTPEYDNHDQNTIQLRSNKDNNTEQSKLRKPTKPTHQFIRESARLKSNQTRLSPVEYDSDA